MSGSSKSLHRAFTTVFDHWEKGADWKASPSSSIIELYNVIDAYNQRHNTLGSLSATINDTLRDTYTSSIQNAADLAKETFFLEILTRLLPMLTTEEVTVWLKTYLRPAVDSAGFDLRFVAKTREFLLALCMDLLSTSDITIELRRRETATSVMDTVLGIYMKDERAYDIIGLVPESEHDSQVHIERIRFIEKNAASLLKEYGLRHPETFFRLLDRYFCVASLRLKALTILAQLLSTNISKVHVFVETPLFMGLLRSLVLDFNIPIIISASSVLVMLVAKVCNKIAKFLPDLFVVFARLLAWPRFTEYLPEREKLIREYSEKNGLHWDVATLDPEVSMIPHLSSKGEFELLYLATVIYGLFPRNLLAFSKAPIEYWKTYPPKILSLTYLNALERLFRGGFEQYVGDKAAELCRRFMLHPNILNQVSQEDELRNPIAWILSENDGEDIGEEEVLLGCLRLNPDIVLTIPDKLVLPRRLISRLYGTGHFTQEISDKSLPHSTTHSHPSSNGGSFSALNRGSVNLIAEGERGSVGRLSLPSHLLNVNRKMSIVPTNLVIENGSSEVGESKINFKSVNFGGATEEKVETEELLPELYNAHEKLFTLNNPRHNSFQMNLKSTQTAAGNFQHAPKTASHMLSEQLKEHIKDDGVKDDNPHSPQLLGTETIASSGSNQGSALDFYQRELLLMKNELEFSSYMKHLNKFNYLKLKLRLNKMLRQGLETNGNTTEESVKAEAGKHAYDSLLESVKALRIERNASLEQLKDESLKIYGQIVELKSQIEELQGMKQELSAKNEDLVAKVELYEKDTTQEKLQALSNELEVLRQRNVALEKKGLPVLEDRKEDVSPIVSQNTKEIIDLRNEIAVLEKQNSKLATELETTLEQLDTTTKSHEKELRGLKLELGEAVRAQSGHYEHKIQELTTAIVKFETALEEKNTRIMQLSTSKPIRIPGTIEMARPPQSRSSTVSAFRTPDIGAPDQRGGMRDYFAGVMSVESSLSSNLSLPSSSAKLATPTVSTPRTATPQTIPIIRGRGGYQKRAKKLM